MAGSLAAADYEAHAQSTRTEPPLPNLTHKTKQVVRFVVVWLVFWDKGATETSPSLVGMSCRASPNYPTNTSSSAK